MSVFVGKLIATKRIRDELWSHVAELRSLGNALGNRTMSSMGG